MQLPKSRRERRGYLEEELCVIDGDQDFNWTVWAAIEAGDYERSIELWDLAGRESEPSYPGTLANQIPLFPGSLGLPLQVDTLSVGERPWLQLHPSEHSLIEDQFGGISVARVVKIAEGMAHL